MIVIHGGSNHTDFGAAARVYWTLKVGGLTRLSVVDGGLRAWKEAGGELATEAQQVEPSDFTYVYDERQIVTREQLAQTLGNGDTARLLDARPAPFFKGEVKPATAARYGTLPGADSFDNAQFFAADGFRLKPRAELLALVQQTGADQGDTVSFCNTGHWAATNWFVISEIAGNKAARMYRRPWWSGAAASCRWRTSRRASARCCRTCPTPSTSNCGSPFPCCLSPVCYSFSAA